MKTLMVILMLVLAMSATAQTQAEMMKSNDLQLENIIKDFHQSARYYKVAHIPEFQKLKEVSFIKSDLNMLGRISETGEAILLNEELKAYPALLRIIFFRQIGKIYSLNDNKTKGHAIMGTHWEINLQHELYAQHLAKREWHDRHFFESLAKSHPIQKRL